MKNYFLQTDVPVEFEEHVSGVAGRTFPLVDIDIVPTDLPYFMLRHAEAAADPAFDPLQGLPDVTTPITTRMLKVADISTYAGDKKRMLGELQFLYIMGLAVIRGSVYYILQDAINLFYGPDGFFEHFNPNAPLTEKQEVLTPVFDHMYAYVLPGRWWRALYGSLGLSSAVEPAVALQREMLEIETVLEKPM